MSNKHELFGHPRGLSLLFFTEMWERFSYYGMRAIFTLYMVKALAMDKSLASAIYGDFTGLVYLTPLLGGLIADRYWGNRRSIIVGGALMALGQFCMFMSALNYQSTGFATGMMFLGLAFLIVGNGFFKPNISTMVGSLYKEGDSRVDSAFSIFYMGINAGALLSPLICGGLGDTGYAESFKWGFLAACVGMVVSLIAFISLKDSFIVNPEGAPIGLAPVKVAPKADAPAAGSRNFGLWSVVLVVLFVLFKGLGIDYIGSFIFSSCLVAPAVIVTDPGLTKIERDRIWVIIIMAFFVICFWAAFEQAGASLTFFAEEQTDRNLLGFEIPASFFQTINPTFIVVFAPIVAMIWGILSKRGQEPPSLIKQAMGLILVGVGYIVICFAVKGMDPNVKLAVWWLISLYFIHTIGELFLSPIGLSMVVRLAPARLASLMMGVWFLSTALANWTAGALSALYPQDTEKTATVKAADFPVKANLAGGRETTVRLTIDSNFRTTVPAEIVMAIPGDTTGKTDTVSAMVGLADGGVWAVSRVSDQAEKPQEPGFGEWFMGNFKKDPLITALNPVEEKPDSLLSIAQTADKSEKTLQPYLAKMIGVQKADPKKFITGFSADGNTLYVLRSEGQLEVWNLAPEKPVILGFEIKDMYTFFLVFVFMAIASGAILLALSRKLMTMMHGIR
jgi:POT family proton-dependent oligopeptide transporter